MTRLLEWLQDHAFVLLVGFCAISVIGSGLWQMAHREEPSRTIEPTDSTEVQSMMPSVTVPGIDLTLKPDTVYRIAVISPDSLLHVYREARHGRR